MSAFRIDHDGMNRIAREAWGLRWPVHLERRRWLHRWGLHNPQRWVGEPRADGQHWRHCIRVRTNAPLHEFLKTLAHELEHAAACERHGALAYSVMYDADERGLERRCQAAEARWRELLPCVRYPQTRGAA